MKAMKYLIKVESEIHGINLFGYDREDVLRIDIAERKPEEFELFRRVDGGFTLRYEPITLEELKAEGE